MHRESGIDHSQFSAGPEKPAEFDLNPMAESKEFEFHQKRFEDVAEKHNQRGTLKKIVDRMVWGTSFEELTEIDAAHEEALRENTDRDRRLLDHEAVEWATRAMVPLERLKEKRDNPEKAKDYRIGLYVGGGGMKCAHAGAQEMAMEKMGYTPEMFSALGGASGGFLDVMYFASKNTAKGESIYYEECTDKNFINFKNWRRILNSSFLGPIMREGPKAVDQKSIQEMDTPLFALVSTRDGHEAEIIDAKTASVDMVEVGVTSAHVPFLAAPGIEVNGKKYIDGAFDLAPIGKIIDKYQLTDLIVLPNRPFAKMEELVPTPLDQLIIDHFPKAGPLGLAKKFYRLSENLRQNLDELKKRHDCNIAVLWPPDGNLGATTTDPDTIKAAVYETIRATYEAFGEAPPEEIELYESEKTA